MIVYTSEGGHTAAYALEIAHDLDMECYALTEDLVIPEQEPVYYFGWVLGGYIQGLKQIRKKSGQIRCVVAVGMSSYSREQVEKLSRKNKLKAPLNYLHGGYDPDRIRMSYRWCMGLFADSQVMCTSDRGRVSYRELKQGAEIQDTQGVYYVERMIKTLADGSPASDQDSEG